MHKLYPVASHSHFQSYHHLQTYWQLSHLVEMWVELKVLNDYDGARFAIQKLKTIEINIKIEKYFFSI